MIEPVKNAQLKPPTGIASFDEITIGGLPTRLTTLVCGNTGSGKTFWGWNF